MEKLTVLYDAACGFCVHCRTWLERQSTFLPLEFVPAFSREAQARFPGLAAGPEREELVVVSDEGGVYRGAEAWIMCLYALREYREWSFTLSRPALLPMARRAFELLSTNRKGLSRLLGLAAAAPELSLECGPGAGCDRGAPP